MLFGKALDDDKYIAVFSISVSLLNSAKAGCKRGLRRTFSDQTQVCCASVSKKAAGEMENQSS